MTDQRQRLTIPDLAASKAARLMKEIGTFPDNDHSYKMSAAEAEKLAAALAKGG